MISRAPIFIGGLMRSGTTLLRAMLGQHPAIAAGLETHWFDIDWPAGMARGKEPLTPYLRRIGSFFEIDAPTIDGLATRCESAAEFLDLFMTEVARRAGKQRWAEKTTGNIRHMDRILSHWPDARILHIIRDPKDVFASFRRSGKYGGPEDYGELWSAFFADVERFKTNDRIAPHLMELRYEALVQAPEQTMAAVLRFIAEPWDDAVAQFGGKADEHERVKTLTGHSSTTLVELAKPLSQDRIGLWSDSLSEAEIDRARTVVAAHGLAQQFKDIEAETLRLVSAPKSGSPTGGGA